MRMPTTRFGIKVALFYFRMLLALRGLHFVVRAPALVRAEDLARIDTCSFISSSLAAAIGGNLRLRIAFVRRALLLALGAGDLERVARCIAGEAAYGGRLGDRSWRRTQRLLQHAHDLAERCGTQQARTHATWAEGQALFGAGQLHAAVECLGRCLEPNDATLQRLDIRWVMIRALGLLGRYAELRRLQQESLRDAIARGDAYAAILFRVGAATLVWLADDRPDLAERHASEAMQEWSTLHSAGDGRSTSPRTPDGVLEGRWPNELPGLVFGPVGTMVSLAMPNLYRGDWEKAHSVSDTLTQRSNVFGRTSVLTGRQLRASSALAMVERHLGDRETLLREVERDARALARAGAWGKGFAPAFRAGIALRRGARADALAGLDAAAREFDTAHMKSYAAAARDRAARLRDDASSASEIASAADVLRAEGVVSPERMIAMLLPGLGV